MSFLVLIGSIPERSPHDPKILYNSAPVFQPDGKLVALHRKLHLFDIDIPNKITFKESETLSAGQDPVTIVETRKSCFHYTLFLLLIHLTCYYKEGALFLIVSVLDCSFWENWTRNLL
jgi:hypothetical protein